MYALTYDLMKLLIFRVLQNEKKYGKTKTLSPILPYIKYIAAFLETEKKKQLFVSKPSIEISSLLGFVFWSQRFWYGL